MQSRYLTRSGTGYLHWNKDFKTAHQLKLGLENSDIDPTLPPKMVYNLSPIYHDYTLDAFQTAMNKIKGEMNAHVKKTAK